MDNAIVIAIIKNTDYGKDINYQYQLEEAVNLTKALDVCVVDSKLIKLREVNSATLLNKGVLEELQQLIIDSDVSLCVINSAISAIQQRNLEEFFECKVMDRNGLIISIFSKRAKSKEGKLQAELAFLTYQKSRIVKAWSHLERQRGGGGFIGGPGETQKELDRRMIGDKIIRLKQLLVKVKRNHSVQSNYRRKNKIKQISLVGYTNAGKSTLFNLLTNEQEFAEDLLFATLDPKRKAIALKTKAIAVLADTVGFISDLPHNLIESFKSTLDEVVEADLIIHCIDVTHPHYNLQIIAVKEVLVELGITDEDYQSRVIEVYNKIDLLAQAELIKLQKLLKNNNRAVLISAQDGQYLEDLTMMMSKFFNANLLEKKLIIPYDDINLLTHIIKNYTIINLNKEYSENEIMCNFLISKPELKLLQYNFNCTFA